ncbi:MAG: response regulator [Anaerolineae bacterium]
MRSEAHSTQLNTAWSETRPLDMGHTAQHTGLAGIPPEQPGSTGQQDEHQQELLAYLGQHVSSIAHELKNPLTIILLQARLLDRSLGTTPRAIDGLAVIQDQALRMRRMVNNMLAFAGARSVQFETTDVNAVLHRTLQVQEAVYVGKVQVHTNLAADLPATQADAEQLQQAFANLISNACQAITSSPLARGSDGELLGRLEITTRLIPEDQQSGPQIQIRFADNGPGIPPDIMPHIFEPFFTTKRLGQGTGLGLSICDHIVKDHNGRIWAENNHLGGVTLIMELPLVESPCHPLAPERSGPPHASEERPRILIVDDEPDVLQTLGYALQQEGYQVAMATDGRQAYAMVMQSHFDLIISDLSMSNMSGQELHRLVAESYPELARRMIFSSGDTSRQRLRSFLRETGTACILKPFQTQELLELIEKMLTI